MKNRRPSLVLAASCAVLLAGTSAHGADYFWDGGTTNIAGNGDGVSAGGTGNWSTAISNWDQGAGLSYVVWSSGNTANFGGAAGTYVVTMTTPISALGLNFTSTGTTSSTGYTVATGSNVLTLGTGGINATHGSGRSTISGAGGITLGGAQTWTTTNAAATLLISSAVTNGGNLLTVDGAGFTQIDGNYTGAGAIRKIGSGTLTMKGTNTFSGGVNIEVGEVNFQATVPNASSTGAIVVTSGARLSFTDKAGGVASVTNNITLNGSGISGNGALNLYNDGFGTVNTGFTGAITLASNTTVRIDANTQTAPINFRGAMTGAGGLTVFNQTSSTGTARVVFENTAKTYAGATLFTNSTTVNTNPLIVELGIANALPIGTTVTFGGTPAGAPAGTFNKSVVLRLNGISQEVAGLAVGVAPAVAGGYSIVGNSATASNLTVNNPATQTFSGVIGGVGTNNNNLSLTKSGVGTLIVGGANTYTGGTIISAGVIQMAPGGTVGGTSGALTINGGSLDLNGVNQSVGVLGGSATGASINSGANGTVTLTVGNGNGSGSFGGIIADKAAVFSGTPVVALTKAGTGTQILSGANTYTGATQITGGTLQSANSGALSTTASVAVAASSTLAVNFGGASDYTEAQVGTLLGKTTFAATSSAFGFDTTNASGVATYGSALTYAGGLTKLGAGTLALTAGNSYTGATTISVGTLQVGAGGTTGTLGSGVINNAGSLIINRSDDLSIASTNSISGVGSFTQAGAGTTTVLSANTYTGATSITAGILKLGIAGALGNGTLNTSGVTVTSGAALDLNSITPTANVALNLNGTTATSGVGALTNSTGTAATYGGAVTLQTASSIGGNSGNLTLSNTISGAVGLTKVGSNTLILTGATNGSTTTTISGGSLQIGNGSTTGALGSGLVSNSGNLTINRSNAFTIAAANAVSGNGSFTQAGAGTTTVTAANSYTGATLISGGTLQIGSAGTTGSLSTSSTITNNGALSFNRTNAVTQGTDFAAGIGGTGGVTQAGSGTLFLSGTNTYSGGTTIAAGKLNLDGDLALGAVPGAAATNLTFSQSGTLQAGAANISLDANRNISIAVGKVATFDTAGNALTINGAVTGSTTSTISKAGTGTLTLNGATTGNLSVANGGGILRVNSAAGLGNGTLTTSKSGTSTGTLQVNTTGTNTFNNAFANFSSSNDLTDAGTANLENVAGNNTFTGNVTITTGGGNGVNFVSDSGLLTLAGTLQNNVASSARIFGLGGAGNGSITGLITNGSASGALTSLSKSGTGTWTLANTGNSFTGGIIVGAPGTAGASTVNAASLADTGTNSAIGAGGNLTLNGGVLQFTGSGAQSTNRSFLVTVAGGSLDASGATSADTLTITGAVASSDTGASNLIQTTGSNVVSNTVTAGIAIAVGQTVTGTGFAPGTTITGIADGGTTITLSQNVTGSGAQGATFGIFGRTLGLTGSNIGDNTVSANLANSGGGGVLGISKSGAGTWVLSGTNAYTGATTVSAGTLKAGSTAAFGSNSAVNLTGATAVLNLNNNANTIGKLDGVASSIVTLGSATLTAGGGDATGGDFAGDISGTGGFSKTGTGSQRLNGANTFTGATAVNGGTLIVSGGLNGTSGVTVGSTGTLAGEGTITPVTDTVGSVSVSAGGKLAPGNNGVGSLTAVLGTAGTFDISTGVTALNTQSLLFDLAAPGTSDRLVLTTGAFNIGAGLDIDDFQFMQLAGFDSGTYTLFDSSSAILGSLANAGILQDIGGGFSASLDFGDSGNDIVLTVVPEPSTAVSLLAGTGLLLGLRRRRS